jgi:hypothetical protein
MTARPRISIGPGFCRAAGGAKPTGYRGNACRRAACAAFCAGPAQRGGTCLGYAWGNSKWQRAQVGCGGGATQTAPSKYHDEIISLVFIHTKYGEPIVIMVFRRAMQKARCLTPPAAGREATFLPAASFHTAATLQEQYAWWLYEN